MKSEEVLAIFKEITKVPRESGHEEPMTRFLCEWAAERGLAFKTDAIKNVMITKEAAPGKEDVPTIVLQAHQDMVCEKRPGIKHDFATDPIRFEIEDGWMVAKDTTLGADDGIGIAAALALLESDRPMGKVECVFTISEETGMDGAEQMEEGFFTGKTLINLDSEDEGQLFIGCAGGENTSAEFKYSSVNVNEGWTRLEFSISDAVGGHSGDDINKGRLNAVRALATFLKEESSNGMQLLMLAGGGKSNAIARDCKAVAAVPDPEGSTSRFKGFAEKMKQEYLETEPDVRFEVKRSCFNEKAMDWNSALNLLDALVECPHGVIRMCPDIEGLVETSTNLASVRMCDRGTVCVSTSQRSSVERELDEIVEKVSEVFASRGAEVRNFSKYPGWEPNVKSHILGVCVDSYRKLFGEEPLVLAIHAGLECGLLLEKFPGLDMISFGPTLRGVHAPGERLELKSMDRFVELLEDVVCNFR